jgi:hypothetical protein
MYEGNTGARMLSHAPTMAVFWLPLPDAYARMTAEVHGLGCHCVPRREVPMRPKIDDTWFGSITVEGTRYEHDIIIRLSGKVRKRNKALSKAVYGTSHTISRAEIEELYERRPNI